MMHKYDYRNQGAFDMVLDVPYLRTLLKRYRIRLKDFYSHMGYNTMTGYNKINRRTILTVDELIFMCDVLQELTGEPEGFEPEDFISNIKMFPEGRKWQWTKHSRKKDTRMAPLIKI